MFRLPQIGATPAESELKFLHADSHLMDRRAPTAMASLTRDPQSIKNRILMANIRQGTVKTAEKTNHKGGRHTALGNKTRKSVYH